MKRQSGPRSREAELAPFLYLVCEDRFERAPVFFRLCFAVVLFGRTWGSPTIGMWSLWSLTMSVSPTIRTPQDEVREVVTNRTADAERKAMNAHEVWSLVYSGDSVLRTTYSAPPSSSSSG